jgi:sulfatase modifying factor 1
MREVALMRPLRSRALGAAALAALVAGAARCNSTETPTGGVLVTMNVEPWFARQPMTRLSIDVGSSDGGTNYADAGYPLGDASAPGAVRFPASFGLVSNGPNANVSVDLGVWDGTRALDIERYVVENVPTTTVVELPVVFGSTCSSAAIAAGATGSCPLGQGEHPWCRLVSDHWLCDASNLPDAGADAGAFLPEEPTDAAPDATLDAAGEASGPDATLEDVTDAGGLDAAMDAVSDAEDDVVPPLDIPCDAPCELGKQCVDGVCVPVPPSCMAGGAGAGPNCGAASKDDCCASDEVRAGSFFRDYDGVDFLDMSYPASVSQFRLDRYEVTVGRFRQFVDATLAGDASPGWTPDGGSGKHTHLNGDSGLSSGGDAAITFETGWDPSWDTYIPHDEADWDAQLTHCNVEASVQGVPSWTPPDPWTPAAGADDNLPITCVNWYQAYAFCIWDGGFLPSTNEWDYAAAGGALQFEYAWGFANPGMNVRLANYGCYYPAQAFGNDCEGLGNLLPVGSVPLGVGVWGQMDLTGNVYEWIFDSDPAPFALPCMDCATTASGSSRGLRGGSFLSALSQIAVSTEGAIRPAEAGGDIGLRCARVP